MASEVLQSWETLLSLAILLALVLLIVRMARSDRPDARMGFLLDLMEGFPKSADP